jgi:hypothetical protein
MMGWNMAAPAQQIPVLPTPPKKNVCTVFKLYFWKTGRIHFKKRPGGAGGKKERPGKDSKQQT